MRLLKNILLLVLISGSVFASGKKVLVEIFTNAHCPLCPPAHSSIESYMQNGTYRDNVTYIFYHMVFPYPDDPMNQANPAEASARNSFYGPFSSTPKGIFDGQVQAGNYSAWAGAIDALAAQTSPFEIKINGSVTSNKVFLKAAVTQTGNINSTSLVINFVAVENVNYTGRNGVSDNKYVMRRMFPDPQGKPLASILNQAIEINQDIIIDNNWNHDQLGFVVFIQDRQTKAIYQSEYVSYNSLTTTGVKEKKSTLPLSFSLFQNYPNPFNPETIISYTVPSNGYVSLKIFDVLGREIIELVNKFQGMGFHEVIFNKRNVSGNSQFASGTYFYTLKIGDQIQTKKMILLK